MSWLVIDDPAAVHVTPCDDVIEHDTHSLDCSCGPDVEWFDPERGDAYARPLVTHASLDGREAHESA